MLGTVLQPNSALPSNNRQFWLNQRGRFWFIDNPIEAVWLATQSRKSSFAGAIEFFGLDFSIWFVFSTDINVGAVSGIAGLKCATAGPASFVSPDVEVFSLFVGAMSSFPSVSAIGLWVLGSMPLCLSFFLMLEFQKFFISLSVLPGNCAAIWDHLRRGKNNNNNNNHQLFEVSTGCWNFEEFKAKFGKIVRSTCFLALHGVQWWGFLPAVRMSPSSSQASGN